MLQQSFGTGQKKGSAKIIKTRLKQQNFELSIMRHLPRHHYGTERLSLGLMTLMSPSNMTMMAPMATGCCNGHVNRYLNLTNAVDSQSDL